MRKFLLASGASAFAFQAAAAEPVQVSPMPAGASALAAFGARPAPAPVPSGLHCPDSVVWVVHRSGKYHFAFSKRFGRGKTGIYACRADAEAAGLEMSFE